MVMDLYSGLFASEKMQQSLVKCFRSVGLAMSPSPHAGCDPYYKQYELSDRHGSQSRPACLSEDIDQTLGGSLVPISSRDGADSDGEPDPESDSDE